MLNLRGVCIEFPVFSPNDRFFLFQFVRQGFSFILQFCHARFQLTEKVGGLYPLFGFREVWNDALEQFV